MTGKSESQQRLTDKEYKDIFSRVPRVCVDLVIKTEDGFLLVKRDIPPHKGKWHTPGGRVLMRESIQDAVERIGDKEVGISPKIEKLLGFMEFPYDGEGGFTHSVSLVFLVHVKSGEIRGSEEGSEIRIFKKVPKNIMPEHGSFLRKNIASIL